MTLTGKQYGQGAVHLPLHDVITIFKGEDVAYKMPDLAVWSHDCVALQNVDGSNTVFVFEDPRARDSFYTCLRILRMSVDLPAQDGNRPAGRM